MLWTWILDTMSGHRKGQRRLSQWNYNWLQMLTSSYILWDPANHAWASIVRSVTQYQHFGFRCSLDTSDGEFLSPTFGSAKHARAGVLAREPGVSTSKSEDLSQDSINKQILAQLSALGDRLATLEHSTTAKCKKSPDVKK